MKRIFIALKVEAGDTLLKMISELKDQLSHENIKWTNTENIHITLAFLGDTEEEKIGLINTMLADKCEGSGQFDLILRGTGVFKSLSDPRIIWTGIDPSESLAGLNSIIKDGLFKTGIIMEDRPFRPHLTLGRVRHLNDKEALKQLVDKFSGFEVQKVSADKVILFESILLKTGPVYKPLNKFNL